MSVVWRVEHGDCREVMRGLADNSMDSAVLDGPYGLGFMGALWDKFGGRGMKPATIARQKAEEKRNEPFGRSGKAAAPAPGEKQAFKEFMREVAEEHLRVLKPGAHAASFGGTRTYHWMVDAWEDAGFEIRDCLFWIYGTGFPKNLNIAKAIDKAGGVQPVGRKPASLGMANNDNWNELTTQLEMPPTTLEAALAWEGFGTALKPGVEPIMLARKPLAKVTCVDLRRATGWDHVHSTSGFSKKKLAERGWTKGTTKRTAKPLHGGVAGWVEVVSPEGLVIERTALPWRPLTFSSVIANALVFGTGGLNIDDCRIGENPGWSYPNGKGGSPCHDGGFQDIPCESTQGRWPSNVILSERTARILDAQSGVTKDGVAVKRNGRGGRFCHSDEAKLGAPAADQGYGSKGGASRFYLVIPDEDRFRYCAKPAKKEKEAGLDAFAARNAAALTGRQEGSAGLVMQHTDGRPKANPYAGTSGAEPRKNTHATVKPVRLLRWLTRLVTPTGGTVLDGFSGSGSGGIAAGLEGFDYVGVELDPENKGYVDIARARIEHWVGPSLWDGHSPVSSHLDAAYEGL